MIFFNTNSEVKEIKIDCVFENQFDYYFFTNYKVDHKTEFEFNSLLVKCIAASLSQNKYVIICEDMETMSLINLKTEYQFLGKQKKLKAHAIYLSDKFIVINPNQKNIFKKLINTDPKEILNYQEFHNHLKNIN